MAGEIAPAAVQAATMMDPHVGIAVMCVIAALVIAISLVINSLVPKD